MCAVVNYCLLLIAHSITLGVVIVIDCTHRKLFYLFRILVIALVWLYLLLCNG